MTQWPWRRLWQAGVTACALHCCVALADDVRSPLVLAAASTAGTDASFAPFYRRGVEEVQQPPADGAAFLNRSAPLAVIVEPQVPKGISADVLPPEAPVAIAPAETGAAASADVQAETAPAVQGNTGLLGLHSAIEFGIMAASRQPVDADNTAFHQQVRRVAGSLEAAAQNLYPEQMKRLRAFDVYVGDSQNLSTMSSGTGRVAINAGFSTLKPTDDWLAFVTAREMGHVLAGHHDNNSGASLAVSLLMNVIVPGSGVIKSVISFAGSQIASEAGHDRQVREADEVAMKLLEAAGYTRKSVALNLRLGPLGEEFTTSWAKDFRMSSARVTGIAPAIAATAVAADQPQSAPTVPMAPVAVPNWQPEQLPRARPSGLPGPLLVGGYATPARYVE